MVSLAKLGMPQGRVPRANGATDATERFLCLVDASEKYEVPWRRLRVRSEKITRSALVWNRLCRRLLVLLINDRVERLSFDRISDIGA